MKALILQMIVLLALPAMAEEPAHCVGGKWTSAGGWSGCLVAGKREGEWTWKLPGGQLIERSEWTRGTRNGKFEHWFETCRVADRGAYRDGQRDGPWVFWTEEGKKDREGSFKAGRETGIWASYHPETGFKHLEGPYVRGLAEGVFTEYLPTGDKWREVKFHQGMRVGKD